MKDRTPPRRFVLYAALSILAALTMAGLTSMGLAQNGVTNRGVLQRMTTMGMAKTSLETLANMTAGRVRFDRKIARTARRNLVDAIQLIPKVFRKPHSDRLSRASPNIWIRWDDFSTRADTAERAAKRLRVDRLGQLRKTLPDMFTACLSCHQTYRKPR